MLSLPQRIRSCATHRKIDFRAVAVFLLDILLLLCYSRIGSFRKLRFGCCTGTIRISGLRGFFLYFFLL